MPDMAGRDAEYKSCIEIGCKRGFTLYHTTCPKIRADIEAAPACSKVRAQLVRVAPIVITSSINNISLQASKQASKQASQTGFGCWMGNGKGAADILLSPRFCQPCHRWVGFGAQQILRGEFYVAAMMLT